MPTNDTPILDILKSIDEGRVALPDFQRGWVWDDEHIKSLLASISLGYPVGAVMMLETGGKDIRFKTRLVEGVECKKVDPELLILDGQQRLTSLYMSTFVNKPVTTRDIKKNSIERWYYLDINKCISPNCEREEAIVSLPKDKILKDFRGDVITDYSSENLEYKEEIFPLNIIFDSSKILNWTLGYIDFSTDQTAKISRTNKWKEFKKNIIDQFLMYQIPIIKLVRHTPKEAVCQVFEKVNTGGVTLNVFELLTATYAVDDFNLRADWKNIIRFFQNSKNPLLSRIENTYFLQTVTLLSTFDNQLTTKNKEPDSSELPSVSCRRKDILKMPLDQYLKWRDLGVKGFEKAAQLLHSQKIFSPWDLPYQTQLVPLAAILGINPEIMDSLNAKEKLMRWYWCGVLGELYHGATETRFAKDLVELALWLEGGVEPSTVIDANFAPTRLFSMCTRNSAAYKGISALLLRNGACDFMSGQTIDDAMYHDENMDIHHIFPRQWCYENNFRNDLSNCIINKTIISGRTNRIIGKKAPNLYVTSIGSNHNPRIDATLESHNINPVQIRNNDFREFFVTRMNNIVNLVSEAMGKPVSGQIPSVESIVFIRNSNTEQNEQFQDIEE